MVVLTLRLAGGLLGLMLGLGLALAARADPADLETAVKASYLYKFGPFVDWPAQAFAGPDSPFVICVVGRDPFGSLLDRAVTGQRVGGRAIVVARLASADHGSACQVAYLGGSRDQSVRAALAALRGAPVLTVTDGPGGPGIVDFVLADNRVRFRIDEAAAAENQLTISSKLLGLALSVNQKKPSGPGQ